MSDKAVRPRARSRSTRVTAVRPTPVRDRRDVVEDEGSALYDRAVSKGWIEADDPEIAPGTPHRDALELLLELGLLRHDADHDHYVPVDPSAASDQLVVPMAHQASELLAESARWSETLGRLGQAFRNSPSMRKQAVTEVHGIEAINSFIDARTSEAETEILTAQPYGKRRASTLAQAEPRDIQALRRGVGMRTLYQHSARQSPATREYVQEVASLGAETRTLDEFFKRLLVFDRHTAIIPATENHAVAIAVHDKSVVDYLVDVFDRAWERALPYSFTGPVAQRAIAADVRAMILRMLVEGHSDAASAKRLGVSTRTYAGLIAALKEEYGVQTRFQLGWAMAQTQDRAPEDPVSPPTKDVF